MKLKKLLKKKKITLKKSGYYKYKCPGCDVTIRATKIVNIKCEDCNEIFKIEE